MSIPEMTKSKIQSAFPLNGKAGDEMRPRIPGISHRRLGDFLLFGITSAELVLLFHMTPVFMLIDWVYLLQHILVLGIALTRRPPDAHDHSLPCSASVLIAYTYPYAQVLYLRSVPGDPGWPAGGLVLVWLAACLSVASLLSMGRRFGVFPALRGLVTRGPYRVVRHPMYLAYMLSDIGYNLQEWNLGTVLLTATGWAALIYRVHSEELILSRDSGWAVYVSSVRSRLLPGIW